MNLLLPVSIVVFCCGLVSGVDTNDLVQPHEKHMKGVPKWIKQPEPVYYVTKDKKATIMCIAEPVVHVSIICAENRYSYMNKHISESGLTVEKFNSRGERDDNGKQWKFSVTINQKQVTDWYSDFKCFCEVWNLIIPLDKTKKIVSTNTFVYDTYFNTKFNTPLKAQSIIEGETLKLVCEPPEAKPPPEISWKRNGKIIPNSSFKSKDSTSSNSQSKNNPFFSKGKTVLTLSNIKMTDSGNYSCIGKSLDVTRISTAQITVIKPGIWSDWSEWDKKCPVNCYQKSVTDCSPECSAHTQRRTRFCKKFNNLKQPITNCRGDSEEIRNCNFYCSYDMWTFWSSWSPCSGNPCQKRRSRRCIALDRCSKSGKQVFTQIVNCTNSEFCENAAGYKPVMVNNQPKDTNRKSSLKYLDSQGLYLALSIAVIVFIVVVIVLACLVNKRVIRLCPNRLFRFSSSSNGIALFHPDKNLKKEFSNLSTAKSVNVIDINGNSTMNGAPNSALLPQHQQQQQVPPGHYRSTMLYPTSNTTSMPFLAAPHHQSVDALTNPPGAIGVYTDVNTNNLSGLVTLANNNGEMPSVGYYSATPLNNAQPNNQNTGPSMIRPSYSDSKVASVLNPNFKNPHLNNTTMTHNYSHPLHYPMTSPLIPPPPPPLLNPHHHYHQHTQINTLPVLPATSLSAASRPSSEHYQELGTTTDHTSDDDDDNDNRGRRDFDDCGEVGRSQLSISGPGINLQHQKQHFNMNSANIKSLITQVTELYPSEQISWASLANSALSSVRLSVPHQDITLTCPLKAVATDKSEVIYLMTSSNEQDLPALNGNETLLSPIIVCGPSSLVVNKPFILSIPHCAIPSNASSSNPNFTVSRTHNSNSNNNNSTHTNTTSTSLSSGNSSIASSGIVTNSDITSGTSNYSNWYITVLTSYSLLTQKPYWQKFVDVPISSFVHDNNSLPNNNSYSNPPGYAHLLKDRLLLMTTQLQRYCIVGCTNKQSTSSNRNSMNPVNSGAIKSMRVVAYSTFMMSHNADMNNIRYNHHHSAAISSEIVVRVYIIPDCQEALSRVHSNETERLGAKLVGMRRIADYGENNNVSNCEFSNDTTSNKDNSCQFPFQDDSGNATIAVSELPSDWQASVNNKSQEIPFQSVWHSSNLHCSFTFVKRTIPTHHNTTTSSHSSSISSGSTTGPNPLPISATTLLQQQYNNPANIAWSCSLYIQQANSPQSKVHVTLFSQHQQTIAGKGAPFIGTPCFVDDCYTSGSKKTTSSSSMTNSQIKDTVAFRIPEHTKFKLAQLLDPQSPHENDWRLLAHFLRVKRSLSFFMNKTSPTEALLDLLEEIVSETTSINQNKLNHQMHQSNVISQLINLLRSKGRLDCIAILEAGLMDSTPQ